MTSRGGRLLSGRIVVIAAAAAAAGISISITMIMLRRRLTSKATASASATASATTSKAQGKASLLVDGMVEAGVVIHDPEQVVAKLSMIMRRGTQQLRVSTIYIYIRPTTTHHSP